MNWDSFVEQVKGFGVANWILIGSVLAILILLIILVCVNIKIMGKYRKDMMKTRVARLVPKIEVIDGWCCLSVENKGQDIATNVHLKYDGSIIKYYNNYISKCRLDDVLRKTMGRGFMLVAGDKKTVRLFPIKTINEGISIMEKRTRVAVASDLDFTGKTEHQDEIEITESFDVDDEKILKGVAKEQAKLLKLRNKQDKKYQKNEEKLNVKRQKAINKYNKKKGKATHTSVVTPPDMSKLIKGANLYIKLDYECLGYLMKYKFKYKNVDLESLPEELNTVRTVLSAQNAIMSEMVLLQNDIRAMLGEKLITAEDIQRIKGVNAVMDESSDMADEKKNKKKKKTKKAKPVVESAPVETPAPEPVAESVPNETPIEEPAVEAIPVETAVMDAPIEESAPIVEEIPVDPILEDETPIEEPFVLDEESSEEPFVLDEEPVLEETMVEDVPIEDTYTSEIVAEEPSMSEDVDFDEFILADDAIVEDTEI